MATTASNTVEARAVQWASDAEARKRYRNFCEGLPALLMKCGLSQTLAYLLAANQVEGQALAKDLADHFYKLAVISAEEPNDGNPHRLLKKLQSFGVPQYRILSNIAAQAAVWQKRMAKAIINTD
jgi:CRISPR type III-B/RAMP module-associated protein Cmr5